MLFSDSSLMTTQISNCSRHGHFDTTAYYLQNIAHV